MTEKYLLQPYRALCLASTSRYRRELLSRLRLRFDIEAPEVDETALPHESPRELSVRLAAAKARAVAARHPGALVIGSDTIVVIDGAILGKPADGRDAIRMLQQLSGRTHTVHTAVAVAHAGQTWAAVEAVQVTFRALTTEQIAAYVATGEPMDKAGAYGIQGGGAVLVDRIDGDYYAVMGLPLARLVRLVEDAGYGYSFAAGISILT